MTREELKAHCKKEIEMCEFWAHGKVEELNNNKIYQEHKLILELLEQEPCEDSISREEAIRIAEQGQIQGFEWQIKKLVTLPPVQSKPKTGYWIVEPYLGYYVSTCSNCNWREDGYACLIYRPKYCPNCGTKMVELQKSEERDESPISY